MPTDHILDRPEDWTQTFWGSAGIQFASLLPYAPVQGEGPNRIVPWFILRRGMINGLELGCALSLHDPSLGKSILERDSTNIDPFWGKTPADWESVYEPVIEALHRRISECGTSGPSYRNMFPESGPDLTRPDASKIIARQVFRGLILPLISEDVAEQVLISGTEEDEPMASSWYFDESSMKGMPIPELLTLVKQRAALAYRQWVEIVGHDYMSEELYDEAVEHYERFLEIEPDNPDVLYAHAVGLLSTSSYAEALDELDRVMELTDVDILRDERFYWWRATALFRLSRYEEAVKDCETYLSRNPDDEDGQSLLHGLKNLTFLSGSNREPTD